MNEKIILSALDIGTTKICAIVGEYDRSISEYRILGIGKVPSSGMKSGVVVDIDLTRASIEAAVSQALQKANVEKITGVTVGIAGDHIRSMDTEHAISINRADNNKKVNVIDEKDMVRLEESIKNINIGIDREIIHIIPQEYIINDQMIVKNPLGMSGSKLTLKAHVITAAINNARDLVNCVQKTGLNVNDIVLEPLASAEAVLTYDQKDLGVCLIDIGGGTTDITVFREGHLISTHIVGFGGEIITRDIASLATTSFVEAERIKKQYGFATSKMAKAQGIKEFYIKPVNGKVDMALNSELLSEFIEARIREIFLLARSYIKGMRLNAGIVLTGGGSLLRGIELLGEEIFNMNCVVGYPIHMNGLEKEDYTPDFATGIGLLHSANKRNLKPKFPSGQSKMTLWNKLKERLSEFF
ncbi:MAG: cell division protein FtsA [Candidatus Marinimicrobia bacterium]|nr:cell division protein FtsA [Candidatus Neomarinimicrobiota bacterium]